MGAPMRLIALSGKARSGKDTAGAALRKHGYYAIALADPIKRFLRDSLDFYEEQLWGPSDRRDEVDPRYGVTPREAIIRASEPARAISRNVWVNAGLRTAIRLMSNRTTAYDPLRGVYVPDRPRPGRHGVVITDIRYGHE